ncbi:hypothetical protein ACH46N_17090 [Streptomyces pristinaespiralis]|jgi:hypothetical protein|uniref:DUF4034 domain-containing protein n=2 Tax=Streptomyces pristinaespiralis TaxID=38300 RepID=B5HC06_STRE2|nr:hypothetical protein [Streptomyces pristinaespiralis]ALC21986.1 putative membrane protein [Streptomyces pristinaespiralis]EDY64367.1 conserved hypothetical protein [Streptomyces pristinaespiralis ATCC 25486]QMU15356.1 hypothetical protein H3L99_18600 [Streptomyces pristinaespiralis]
MAVRRRFVPDFDPAFGDRPLTDALHDIVIGRWQGVRDLLHATGDDWPLRTHRIRLLAHAAAGSSTAGIWRAAEPHRPDAAVLYAATEVVRAFQRVIATGRGAADRERLDAAVRACLDAADAHPADPMPWVSLLTVARLYEDGVPRRELRGWWDELRRRDPYNVEGHVQLLRYHSARWHGSHGRMYDFARDAAGASPPGSPLPVLVQIARAEEYRYISDAAQGRVVRGFDQHWKHELAIREIRRTWERWVLWRTDGPVAPEEIGELNYLTHAACLAGLRQEAGGLFTLLGTRAAYLPWAYTGDAAEQFTRWRAHVGATS